MTLFWYVEASEIKAWHHHVMLSGVTTGSLVYIANFSGMRIGPTSDVYDPVGKPRVVYIGVAGE